jgi:hypothetical protein
MNTRYLFVVSLLCLTGLAACGGSPTETSQPQPAAAPAAQPATPPAEQYVAGQLTEIDMNAKTLVLKDASGTAHSIAFSETTRLTGAAGVQDLRGQEGNNATIRYVESGSRKSALQIHIEAGS